MKSDRINSLSGLRVLAMLTVFCSHLDYHAETPLQFFSPWIDNGRFGVNFFLVLSGFVLALGYSEKLNARHISQDVRFIKKRISKIYIPYLITLILAIPLHIYRQGSLNIKLLISRLIINIAMLQSVIPFAKYSISINDVSWFISTISVLYLFTPGVLGLNYKASKRHTLIQSVVLLFAVLFSYICFYMIIRWIEYIRFADCGLSIIYRSPLIRLFPFLFGIVAYNIYCLPGNFRIQSGSPVEILGIALFLLWWIIADKTGLPTVVTECTDMLVSMLVILIFAFSRRGIVSGLLSKEKMLGLGKISLEFYLVHYLIINYGILAANHFGFDKGMAVIPLTFLFFALSLFGACLIHSVSEWILLAIRKENNKTV